MRPMRRAILLAFLAIGGAACATGARWERPGATEVERRRDETECAAQASRDRSVPVQRVGTPSGRPTDGIDVGTVRDFESGVFAECMRTRGYERVPARPPA
jgi:hypothetical protein